MINLNLEPIFSLIFSGDVRLVGFIVTLKEFEFAAKFYENDQLEE